MLEDDNHAVDRSYRLASLRKVIDFYCLYQRRLFTFRFAKSSGKRIREREVKENRLQEAREVLDVLYKHAVGRAGVQDMLTGCMRMTDFCLIYMHLHHLSY